MAGLGQPVRQQLGAGQVLGRKAQAQQLQQVAAGTATHLQYTQARQIGPAQAHQQLEHRPLPLLHRLPDIGLQKAVAVEPSTPGVALGHGVGFVAGRVAGRAASLVVGLATGLITSLITGSITGLIAGLITGLITGLIAGLATGRTTGQATRQITRKVADFVGHRRAAHRCIARMKRCANTG